LSRFSLPFGLPSRLPSRFSFHLPLGSVVLSALLLAQDWVHAQGGSAVITLVMPVGARQLGMGETAVALADDVFGTFWNPAGLAFGPVAHEWDVVQNRDEVMRQAKVQVPGADTLRFTTLATKPRTGFLVKSVVWTGTNQGLMYYDGKNWHRDHAVVLEEGDDIVKIVRRYLGTGDNLDSVVAKVKAYNQVATAQDEADLISLHLPYDLLFPGQPIQAMALDNSDRLWVGTPIGLFRFDGQGWKAFDKEEGFTYIPADTTTLATSVAPVVPVAATGDSASADSTLVAKAGDSAAIAAQPAVQPVVGATDADAEAVSRGGTFRTLSVQALAVKGASIWIGTDQGLYEYRRNVMVRRGEAILPQQNITAIALHESADEIFVALKNRGLARYIPAKSQTGAAKWKLFNVADGLLDSAANAVSLDKYGHVYAAHRGGLSHFTGAAWERIHFKNQDVTSLSFDESNALWIGTDEGAWKHVPYYANPKGRLSFSRTAGQSDEEKAQSKRGTWTHFHTGNGLNSKKVAAVQTQGPDVWFLTQAGVERYNSATSQVGFFYEALLPVLNLPDLYHAYAGGTFPIEDWGTLGGYVNYVSFGENVQTDAEGTEIAKFDAYELVAGISYATRLTRKLGLGVNAKFIYSALAQGVTSSGEKSDGIARSYAVDVGMLYKDLLLEGLSFGAVLQNMGPAVFYVDQAQSDPIPFTWKLGLAYEVFHTADHRFIVAADVNREAVYRDGNEPAPFWEGAWKALAYPKESEGLSVTETWEENVRLSVFNFGAEYTYANIVALRSGILYDDSGKRYEYDLGLGFMISDILQIDGTFIRTFSDNAIRNNQKRFSMILRF
jgi:Type IX secretion system protein PorV